MAEKIMIVSGKGGVGKSTICTGIAAGLSVRGGRVLILETDNGFRGLDISLSVEDTAVYDLADVLESRCEIGDALLRHNRYGMELLCAPLDPSYLPREEQLKTLVLWADRNYDWLLTDCGAGFGGMETMLVGVCDQALIVTTPEPVAVRCGGRVSALLHRAGLHQQRLVINRIPKVLRKSKNVRDLDDVIDLVGAQLLGAIPEAEELGMPSPDKLSFPAYAELDHIARRLMGEDAELVLYH